MLQKDRYERLCRADMLQYLEDVPYDVFREQLYSPHDLLDLFDPDDPASIQRCYDYRVYQHYLQKTPLTTDPMELWARTAHDTAICNAMNKVLVQYLPCKVVGIMGGHELLRTDPSYWKVMKAAKAITEKGGFVLTGGGPGAMEAAHLGAWLAGSSEDDILPDVQHVLEQAPSYKDPQWYPTAWQVIQKYPQTHGFQSLAIPTWLYGHEPTTLFATYCAKLFSNCIREDALIMFPYGGLVFMPGSAGTIEEVFLATERNHYLLQEYPSPMIFVERTHWTENAPIYPVVQDMLKSRHFKNLLVSLVDDVDSIIDIINDFHRLYPLIRAKRNNSMSREQ